MYCVPMDRGDNGDDRDLDLAVRVDVSRLFAHDFNNAVSAIFANLSYLELVAEDLDTDFRKSVEDCNLAVKLLSHMFNNFVLIARLEAGRGVDVSTESLAQLTEQSLKRARELVSSSNVALELGAPVPEAACRWELQYARLALDNLLLVSAQSARPGSSVAVEAGVDGGSARFGMAWDGYAISPDAFDDLFTRAGQVQAKSKKGSIYGRAMGLYAVGLVARRFGGCVGADRSGDLNRFSLALPLSTHE